MTTSSSTQQAPAQAPSFAPREPGTWFRRVQGGYHTGQVEDHIRSMGARIRDLEQRLAHAVEHGAAETASSQQAHDVTIDMMRIAMDEIAGERARARADIAQMVADATARHDKALADAQTEAQGLITGARQQADVVLNGARADAKRITDQAAAQAAAVTEGAERRMQYARDLHAKTLARIQDMHDVTGKYLAVEQERGSLDDEVARALPGSVIVAASAPAQLTAAAGVSGDATPSSP